MSTPRDDAAGPNIETLEATLDVTYSWGYEDTREQLRDLYTKAKRSQWRPEEVLDFSIDVDLGKPMMPEALHPLLGSDLHEKLTPGEHERLHAEMASWTLSQFLHGEQGALLAAAQLVMSVPDLDSKLYGGTQVVDEARHVDVYNRYLHEKIGFSYPVNPHLKSLLDLILTDSRWDMKFLGMQIMVEGLALAAFGVTRMQMMDEPLIQDLITRVMADESRHVAFGVLSLADLYANEMTSAELREREEFVIEATHLLRDRLQPTPVFEHLGWDAAVWSKWSETTPFMRGFRQMMFQKIVPNLKRLGLLTPRVRAAYEKLDLLRFEHEKDSIEDPETTPPAELVQLLMEFMTKTAGTTDQGVAAQ